MNDAEYEALKAKIKGHMDYWTVRLGLRWWRVVSEYVRDSGDMKTDGNRAPDTAANCAADWRYMHATIKFNMPVYAESDADEQEYIVVHELCHVLVNETRDPEELKGFTPHEERVATTLAKAFIWTRDMTRDEAKL